MYIHDSHVHTKYSFDGATDGSGEIDTIIETAIARGVNEISLTDHCDIDDILDGIYLPLGILQRSLTNIRIERGGSVHEMTAKSLAVERQMIGVHPYVVFSAKLLYPLGLFLPKSEGIRRVKIRANAVFYALKKPRGENILRCPAR